MGKLDGKVALVTGGNRGIGKAIARALAAEGAALTLAARGAGALAQTAREIAAEFGVEVLDVPTDVADEAQVDALFTSAQDRHGRLDILINNAGAFDGGPIEEITMEEWHNVVGACLTGPFLCTRAAFRTMKEQGGGRIINIGSISAQMPRMYSVPYTATKHGVWGLTKAAALEGRDHGIVVSQWYHSLRDTTELVSCVWLFGCLFVCSYVRSVVYSLVFSFRCLCDVSHHRCVLSLSSWLLVPSHLRGPFSGQ